MSIQTQIERISGNVASALSAIRDKGVTVPEGSNSDALAELIEAIQTGGGASGANIATGSFLPALSRNSYEITHNLGRVPTFAFCYRTFNTNITSSSNTFIYVANINGIGICVWTDFITSGSGYTLNGGTDNTHSITDVPTTSAPYIGAYGATETKIMFGAPYFDGDTYRKFDGGWDTFNWVVG